MGKPWGEMPDRERDAMVAERVMGLALDYEFADIMNGPTVPALPDQYDEWGVLPSFTTDYNDAHLVENEIERRDLWMAYTCALQGIVWSGECAAYDYPDAAAWCLIRASAAQRCEAALKAIGAL